MALPITLEEAKRQLKVELDETDQDNEIEGFIRDAAAWVEDYTGLILEARQVVEHFSGFRAVALRAWPIDPTAVVSVTYADGNGSPVPVSAVIDVTRRPATVSSAPDPFWPFVNAKQRFSVTVRAGFESPDDVPRALRRAMLVMITAFDVDREGGPIFSKAETAAKNLCRRYKRYSL